MTVDYPAVDPERRPRGSLADEVVTYVRDLILAGSLKPGARIDQDAIAQALDVSRSPVREALVILSREGLVEMTPRRGASVADLTPADIVDHYELFGMVSGRVAAMAAVSLKDDEIAQLAAIHERFERDTGEDLSALNNAFHRPLLRVHRRLGLAGRSAPRRHPPGHLRARPRRRPRSHGGAPASERPCRR